MENEPVSCQEQERHHFINTKRYFAKWFGVEPELLDTSGVFAMESEARRVCLPGYSKPFAVLCFLIGNAVLLSYRPELGHFIADALKFFDAAKPVESLSKALETAFSAKPTVSRKHYFTELPPEVDLQLATRLTQNDYNSYRVFFERQYGQLHDDDAWLFEYYTGLVKRGYGYAVRVGHELVSVADAPDVPYMSDQIVEPGIATLADYRRRGYARAVCMAQVKYMVENHMTPVWSCIHTNVASMRLAEALGFRQIGVMVTLSVS